MAWIRYATESVKYIFFSPSDAIEQARTHEIAQKIEDFLLARGQATRREITMEGFHGHVTKSRIDAAIGQLLNTTPPRIRVRLLLRPQGLPGSSTKIYSLDDEIKRDTCPQPLNPGFSSQSSHSSLRILENRPPRTYPE